MSRLSENYDSGKNKWNLGPHSEISLNLRNLASGGAGGLLTLIAALAQL
jgi:hypothetical protein